MKRRLGIFAVIAVIIFPQVGKTGVGGSPAEDIPLDSWVYDAVFELSAQGLFDRLMLHTRPYRRGEVASGVREALAEDSTLREGSLILLRRLQAEFQEELTDRPGDETGGEYVRLGLGPNARADQSQGGYAKNRAGFDAVGSFGVGNRLAVRTRVRFDSDARRDNQFRGEYWDQRFTAWVDQAVLTSRYRNLRIAFGREFWRWGRSPVDAMLLSDQSPPFDGMRLTYRSGRWAFSFHATKLDSMRLATGGTASRYLSGHRIDWRVHDNLELAISEVVVYGGVNRPWALNYLNPFLPYYWEQLNSNTNDNPLWNIEWSWRPRPGMEIYGEWLIDDFQIDLTSEPHQIGGLIGWAWSGIDSRLFINGEYQRINTFVYGQGRPYNRYFHYRNRLDGSAIGIGSNLGPDADRMTLRPKWHQSDNLDLVGLIEYVRHGQDRIDSTQASGVPKGVPFPSGTVERRTTIAAGARLQFGGHLIGDILIGYESVRNINNVTHADREGLLLKVRLVTLLWKTMRI